MTYDRALDGFVYLNNIPICHCWQAILLGLVIATGMLLVFHAYRNEWGLC